MTILRATMGNWVMGTPGTVMVRRHFAATMAMLPAAWRRPRFNR